MSGKIDAKMVDKKDCKMVEVVAEKSIVPTILTILSQSPTQSEKLEVLVTKVALALETSDMDTKIKELLTIADEMGLVQIKNGIVKLTLSINVEFEASTADNVPGTSRKRHVSESRRPRSRERSRSRKRRKTSGSQKSRSRSRSRSTKRRRLQSNPRPRSLTRRRRRRSRPRPRSQARAQVRSRLRSPPLYRPRVPTNISQNCPHCGNALKLSMLVERM